MKRLLALIGLHTLALAAALFCLRAELPVAAANPAISPAQAIVQAIGQIGPNDFRISDMGPAGSNSYSANTPDLAYNSVNNQYLVVWSGDHNAGGLVDNEFEIFGQIIDAATGAAIGNNFRISRMGPDNNLAYGAYFPAVAYNSLNNEYLVVWYGDHNAGGLVDGELEIFGQRLSAATGALIGGHVRYSSMGPNGDPTYQALYPAVAYNSINNRYLVVWQGDHNSGGLANDEYEIFGQAVNGATGAEIGGDFRISDMGPDGNPAYDALNPAVSYNSTDNEYLVVWQGDDNTGLLVDNELEIFGQRINAATGAEVGINDFRISFMGPLGDPLYAALNPAVVYNPDDNQYLVVWQGDDNVSGRVNDEYEIYGQRMNAATGAAISVNRFRLSEMGGTGDPNFAAINPDVTYNSAYNEYLVVWSGDDNIPPLVNGEMEIFGQRVAAATGAQIGGDTRLSDMGPDGSTSFATLRPAVAYSSAANQYLVVWQGDDNTPPLVDGEFEIFGQRIAALVWTYLPLAVK